MALQQSWSRNSRWTRTVDGVLCRSFRGDRLLLSVQARFKTGLGTVINVTRELQKSDPAYEGDTPESLKRAYYHVLSLPPRPITEKDQWMSDLQRWGFSSEVSFSLLDRLVTIVTKIPGLGLPYINQTFNFVRHARRLRTTQSKIKWFERAVSRLENGRLPIRPWDKASNSNIDQIGAALREGLSSQKEIAAACKEIKPRTVQDLLVFMASTGDAVRKKHGHYGPPQEGAAPYVRPGELVLKALERGPSSRAEIQEHTGLTEAQVTAAVHWLWRRAHKIERLKPDLYALPGTAPVSHMYAHDAFALALVSGEKLMCELVEITGKNSGALWRAFRGRLSPDGIAKRIGFRNGSDVRPGLRGCVAVFALTAKGRRYAQRIASNR